MSSLHFTVLLFAAARETAGREAVELESFAGSTIADLRAVLLEQFPKLRPLADSLLWAVNNEYAADDRVIDEHDSIACFPPVSGG